MATYIPDRDTTFQILDSMLKSDEFAHTDKYQELLKFLVNALLNSETVTEKIIATKIFGKDDSFDPVVDSSVRAYMSNLRKKVEHFNLTSGKDSDIHITLPKGGYHVEFVKRASLKSQSSGKSIQSLHFIYSSVILIFLVIFIILYNLQDKSNNSVNTAETSFVWHNLFESKRKTLIVPGDYYFFKMALDSANFVYARNIFINSDNDLNKFLKHNSAYQKDISNIYHAYLDEHIPLCVSQITASVTGRIPTDFKLSSEIRLEDLQNYNIIYIGSYKTLYQLETVTSNLNFSYIQRSDESILEFLDTKTEISHSYSFLTNPDTQARNDYAIFVKVEGHNNNTFYFFISQHDFGNLATVKYFTNPERIAQFNESISSDYFEALFEVTGIVRTDFDIKLLLVNELHSNFEIKLE